MQQRGHGLAILPVEVSCHPVCGEQQHHGYGPLRDRGEPDQETDQGECQKSESDGDAHVHRLIRRRRQSPLGRQTRIQRREDEECQDDEGLENSQRVNES